MSHPRWLSTISTSNESPFRNVKQMRQRASSHRPSIAPISRQLIHSRRPGPLGRRAERRRPPRVRRSAAREWAVCPPAQAEVVEQVERLRLRLEIQLPLKRPDTVGRLQAHRQSPILVFLESAPELRVLPSTGIARHQQYYDPVRLPPAPTP